MDNFKLSPIKIILNAYEKGLSEVLKLQIPRHHQILNKSKTIFEAREYFHITDENTHYSTWNNDIFNSLHRKRLHKPVDDESITSCYKCLTDFSMMVRKHHCRACGQIFCYKCSSWNEIVPTELVNYVSESSNKPVRVCEECKDKIYNYRKIEHVVKYFEIIAFPFELCTKASVLSKDWRNAMKIYLSNVRDIQYYLPSTILTEKDKMALKSNMNELKSHSKWLIQILKMGYIEINNVQTETCNHLMCDKNCKNQLTVYDAIILLNSKVYGNEVKQKAIHILEQGDFINELSLFLPIENEFIQEFVLSKHNLFKDFFYYSRIPKSLESDIFKNKLLLANSDTAKLLQESIHLISILETTKDINTLSKLLKEVKTPFLGPFGIVEHIYTDISIKNSATAPILIRYEGNNTNKEFLYKYEDIRKDAHIMSLVKLMYCLCDDIFPNDTNKAFITPTDLKRKNSSSTWHVRDSPISPSPLDVFSRNEYYDVDIVDKRYLITYGVIPTSSNSGFIEIVQNTCTLREILANGTISNYLYKSNVSKTVMEINSNYSASLAFWTVVTYLLGVGDRHLENIMIRDDGVLFHIDYGFVFGEDTTSSYVRLDTNLIEGLGGNSMYEPFKEKCCDIFCKLRDNFDLIYSCLMRLTVLDPPIKNYNTTFMENFGINRFLLGQSDKEARELFGNIMDVSRNTLLRQARDMIHSTMSNIRLKWWSDSK